jgi:DNA-binding transcriptional ArsR family regulator
VTAAPHDRPADHPVSPFDALGDPVRRRLMVLLSSGEQSVGELVDALQGMAPISQPAVSQHLAVLRGAGLVRVRAQGTRRLHSLDPDGVVTAQRWLGELLDPLAGAAGPLDALATEVARGRRERRAAGAATSGEQPEQRPDRGPRRSSA